MTGARRIQRVGMRVVASLRNVLVILLASSVILPIIIKRTSEQTSEAQSAPETVWQCVSVKIMLFMSHLQPNIRYISAEYVVLITETELLQRII